MNQDLFKEIHEYVMPYLHNKRYHLELSPDAHDQLGRPSKLLGFNVTVNALSGVYYDLVYNPTPPPEVRIYIKEWLRKHALSVSDLSKATGVTRQIIDAYLNGNNDSVSTEIKILNYIRLRRDEDE